MAVGPHVFGNDRRGLWVQSSSGLTSKLTHFLPRVKNPIPNLTDIFLPEEALMSHRDQVRNAGFFAHTYAVNHGRTAVAFADAALVAHARQKTGALELNIEGLPEANLATYVTNTVKRVRSKKPNLPVRINFVPWKGQWVPHDLFKTDKNLYAIVQVYGGNMDALYAADDVLQDQLNWGMPPEKLSAMHAVMCAQGLNQPRQITLPQVRGKGSFYIDDLLLDAGLI